MLIFFTNLSELVLRSEIQKAQKKPGVWWFVKLTKYQSSSLSKIVKFCHGDVISDADLDIWSKASITHITIGFFIIRIKTEGFHIDNM